MLDAGLGREQAAHQARLGQFLKHDGIEPTNIASARALRRAVIWRKLPFGTQSPAGSKDEAPSPASSKQSKTDLTATKPRHCSPGHERLPSAMILDCQRLRATMSCRCCDS